MKHPARLQNHVKRWVLGMTAALAVMASGPLAEAKPHIQYDKAGVPLSAPEEAVDQVAHHYEIEAIKKLQSLLARPKSAEQEANLLVQLAVLQQKRAEIVFRIAHANAYAAKKPIDLRGNQSALKESVSTLSKMIEKYPTHREIPGAYLMRAKALRELNDKKGAIADFLFIEKNFPSYPELKSACIELADIAEEAQDWRTAVKYLLMVLKQKRDSEQYPYALHRLAWAHYQLGNIDKSMAYVDVHTKFQNALIKRALLQKRPYTMYMTARETLLQDASLFYLKGLQLRLPGYSMSQAISYLQRLVSKKESDPALTSMVLRFTSLLRAEGMYTEMNQWKSDVIRAMPRREVSLKVLTIVLEDNLNKYRYAAVNETVDDILRLHQTSQKLYSFQVAESLLLNSASKLQEIISKDKDASSAKEPTLSLEKIYKTYLSVAQDENQLARVHYNLAEALASLERFDEAAVHYRWIFDKARNWDAKKLGGVKPLEAATKALAINYDTLKKRNVIPKDLKPRVVEEGDPSKVDSALLAWFELVEQVDKEQSAGARSDKLDFFRLETHRALYASGRVLDSIQRMDQFVRKYPASSASTPSAKLVIDTWIASQRWSEAEETARAYGALAWPDAKFAAEMQTRAADYAFKVAETEFAKGEHDKVLAHGTQFLERYPSSPRREDVLSLVARSAAQSGNEQVAGQYLSAIVTQGPNSKYFDKALLTRAEMAEKRHDYAAASKDFQQYLTLPAGKRSLGEVQLMAVRKKILLLGWLDAQSDTLPRILRDRQVCVEELFALCDRYSAWVQIQGGSAPGRKLASKASPSQKGKHSPLENEALWALRDLVAQSSHLGQDARVEKLQLVSANWSRIDPMMRFTLIPTLQQVSADAFRIFRDQVKSGGRLRLDPKSIQKRVEKIKKVEVASNPVMKLPFTKSRLAVLNETASMYMDLASELVTLDPPGPMSEEDRKVFSDTLKNIASPFEKTGLALRKKAFELAANASVDHETFRAVSGSYFSELGEASAAILPKEGYPSVVSLDLSFVKDFESELWGSPKSESPLVSLREEWLTALNDKHWTRAAFALQEAQEKSLLEPTQIALMRAVSLAAIGARAEGLGELSGALASLSEGPREKLRALLIRQYTSTLGKLRVLELLKDQPEIPGSLDSRERQLVGSWLGVTS